MSEKTDARTESRTVIVVQARMRSSRLPGKVLRKIAGRPVLDVIIERLRRVEMADLVVVATTTDPADDPIRDRARQLAVPCIRGSEDDVLARYAQAATEVDATIVVRVTADCPLIEPEEIDRLLVEFAAARGSLDFLRNQAGEDRRIPRGLDVEVFSREALLRAHAESREILDREHVTPYLYRVPGRFRTRVSEPEGDDLSHLRLTIDTPADLEVVDRIVTALGVDAPTDAVVAFLDAHPDVARLNSTIQQKALDADEARMRQAIDGRLLVGRADASAEMGSGHVARLASLLGAWTLHGGRARLYSAALPAFWIERLEDLGVDVEDAPASFAELASMSVAEDAAAACVDGYTFTADEIRTLNDALPVVRIDDFVRDTEIVADVVVDPNLGASTGHRSGPGQLLAGADFALLRPEFNDPPDRASDAEARILVTFGSSDPARVTVRCTEALGRLRPDGARVAVIAGPSMHADDAAAVQRLAAGGAIEVLRDVKDMPRALRSARVGVTAAGTTILEFLAMGCVPFAVQVADNQGASGGGLGDSGLGFDLGDHVNIDFDALAERAWALLRDRATLDDLARRGMAAVDRRGVHRILDAMLAAMQSRETGNKA